MEKGQTFRRVADDTVAALYLWSSTSVLSLLSPLITGAHLVPSMLQPLHWHQLHKVQSSISFYAFLLQYYTDSSTEEPLPAHFAVERVLGLAVSIVCPNLCLIVCLWINQTLQKQPDCILSTQAKKEKKRKREAHLCLGSSALMLGST